MKKTLIAYAFSVFGLYGLSSAQQAWNRFPESEIPGWERVIIPEKYDVYKLNLQNLRNQLSQAPLESVTIAEKSQVTISLPMPDGSFQTFKVAESPIMEQGLADQFPLIHTYAIKGVEDKTALGRLDVTHQGFHAMIFTSQGTVFIDPYHLKTTEHYLVYFKHDFKTTKKQNCLTTGKEFPFDPHDTHTEKTHTFYAMGDQLRTYRLAVATTGEYTTYHGGTTGAMSAVTTTVNRVNGVLNRDFCIKFNLIANNNLIIYPTASSDPYQGSNANTMIGQNQTNIDAVIGNSNYDIGHLFATAGAGLAFLEAICDDGSKARGITGISAPVGDAFDIDYVAHEMGHQLGGNHSFNNCGGSGSTSDPAHEPGSGVTIMGYAGICGGGTDLAQHSIDIYHGGNFKEIANNILFGSPGGGCATILGTNNTAPDVTVPAGGFYIPKSTPFELTGSAVDPDGDAVTYCWEQVNAGTSMNLTNPTSGTGPLFRSWLPDTSPTRVFPRLTNLVNNTTVTGEKLPSYARSMKFRCTVRDNKSNGGGIDYNELTFNVTANAGPFLVNYPNTNIIWKTGLQDSVKWDVAGTTANNVNCANVNIKLSLDGGFTYPITLVSNTPNDGFEMITVPTSITTFPQTKARVRVEAVGNIFFDISNANFRIESGATALENGLEKYFNLFPNPTTGILHVDISSDLNGTWETKVLDVTGREVKTAQKIQNQDQMNLSDLPKGIYFVEFKQNNQVVRKKIVIAE